MTAQGVSKNVLDGLAVGGMIAIPAAAALSGAEVDPVPRAVAGSTKTGTVHEGFKKERAVTVKRMPILRQPACRQGQDLAGKSTNGNPGQHQKPAVRDDELKIAFPLFSTPSDPGITGCHHPCGTGKLQAGQIAPGQLAGLDEIAQVSAEGNAIAEVMVAVDILLEQGIESPVGSLDEVKSKGMEIPGASGHRGLSVALRGSDNAPWAGRSCGTKTWQGQNPLIPEMLKKCAALFILEFPGGSFPLEQFADGFGQFGQAEVGEIADSLTDEFELGSPKVTTGKGNLRLKHACFPLLPLLPYPERERMSGGKCMAVRRHQERPQK